MKEGEGMASQDSTISRRPSEEQFAVVREHLVERKVRRSSTYRRVYLRRLAALTIAGNHPEEFLVEYGRRLGAEGFGTKRIKAPKVHR